MVRNANGSYEPDIKDTIPGSNSLGGIAGFHRDMIGMQQGAYLTGDMTIPMNKAYWVKLDRNTQISILDQLGFLNRENGL